jgi:hypothetical protein
MNGDGKASSGAVHAVIEKALEVASELASRPVYRDLLDAADLLMPDFSEVHDWQPQFPCSHSSGSPSLSPSVRSANP